MNRLMTLEQMLEAGRPAYSQDLSYRFDPRRGFAVACFTRFAPAWLQCSIPSGEVLWSHEETCDCHVCRPAPIVAEPKAKELSAVA